jgi:drug/metabolite transporter (DMT)-like permease
VSVNTIVSQLLLKKGIIINSNILPIKTIQSLIKILISPFVLGAIFLQIIGYIVWIFVISRMKLGLAFAISGSFFYILLALASWVLYKEKLSSIQWIGLVLITSGVLCIAMK